MSPSTGLHHVVIQAHTEFKDKQYSFHITHNQNSYTLIYNISTYLQRERKLLILSRSRKIHYGNQEFKKKKESKTEVILPQTIHSLLGELQLSVERGDQMLFSDRNGSNPRPCCNNKISTFRHHYS